MTATRGKKARRKKGYNRRLGKRRRGQGNRGGTGGAGGGKRQSQKLDLMINLRGKVGRKAKLKAAVKAEALNIDDLNILISKEGKAKKGTAVKYELGDKYGKLLGRGKPEYKYEISGGAVSAKAKVKIEKAGGKVLSEVTEEQAKDSAEESE